MFKSYYREKEIKVRLSEIGKTHPQLYNLLLEKIEFSKYHRFKKTIRQSIRKLLTMGIKEYIRDFLNKDVVNKINHPSNKKKILFIAGLTANIIGISLYLRKTGKYETILLIENPWLVGFFKQYFDTVYIYSSSYEVACLLIASHPYIVHVQGSLNYYFLGVLAKCLTNAIVVVGFIDPPSFEPSADNPAELSKKTKDTQLDCFSEEFLFKRCDGIILTMNTIIAGEKLRQRYNSNVPILEFPPYACDEFFREEEKYSQKNGKIYLVYGGVVASSDMPKEIFGAVQFIDIARSLTNQGLCYHIYLSPYFSPIQFGKLYADYIRLAAKTPHFAFKQGVPLDKAIGEFSKYDFGAMIHLTEGTTMNVFHFNTCISSKFFTYLSAGLPVIVSDNHGYISTLVKEYECGIVVGSKDINNLSEIVRQYDYEKLRTNVRRAREDFSMKKHIGRLVEFYGQACSKSTNSIYEEKA